MLIGTAHLFGVFGDLYLVYSSSALHARRFVDGVAPDVVHRLTSAYHPTYQRTATYTWNVTIRPLERRVKQKLQNSASHFAVAILSQKCPNGHNLGK